MPELELIGAAPSNYVWTCRIALAEKGVPYRHTEIMPHTPQVDAIHPFMARKSVQETVPTWIPGQARSERVA
jgi:glutathione S-transferase